MLAHARQIALPGVGLAGQARLASARVLVVGAGGLGSPVALWLAAAGVGRLGLADPDRVELSNLHRQLLYAAADVGRPKVEAAGERLRAHAPTLALDLHPLAVDATNAAALVAAHDVVVDATDQLPVRYALSDACVAAGRPLVHGSVSRWEGRATVLAAPGGPCYRCLWPDAPPPGAVPTCDDGGVLGPVPGLVGMLQATEVLKLLLGLGDPLVGRLLVVDALRMVTHAFAVRPDPLCPACGPGQIRTGGASAREAAAGAPVEPTDPPRAPAPSAPEPPPVTHPDAPHVPELSPSEVAERLRSAEPPVLLDVREPWEHKLAHIDGARLVPLNSLPHALSTLDPAAEYVVHCHHGVRSMMAAQFLKERGLTRVANLAGGIDAWSVQVDPAVPRY